MKLTHKGFTIVELLVTISIIAILSAVGLVVYSSVIKQGRDSKRQADLRAIQSALEQYYADQSHYPFSITPGSPFSRPSGNTPYMNEIPHDPTQDPDYKYEVLGIGCTETALANCTSYCLYANLDKPGLGNTKPSGCTNSDYTFAVTPPI